MCVLVAQLGLTLFDPMDCSPPGSSVHGILQLRTLEWVAVSSSRGSSQPKDQTWVSCIAGGLFSVWVTREALSNSKKTIEFNIIENIMVHLDVSQTFGLIALKHVEVYIYYIFRSQPKKLEKY